MSQLTDMFKGLMFLQGHVIHPEDGTIPPAWGNRAASERWFAAHGGDGQRRDPRAEPGFSLAEHLAFLGGRPMHAGHNLDLDEPFEQLGEAANDAEANDDAASRICATC